MQENKPILFFDGHCNLCNGFIRFLIPFLNQKLLIASLQGTTAKEKLPNYLLQQPASVVLLDQKGHLYFRSSAIFKTSLILKGPLMLLLIFWPLPRPLTDAVYNWVSRNRFRFFGQSDACRVPTTDELKYFLP